MTSSTIQSSTKSSSHKAEPELDFFETTEADAVEEELPPWEVPTPILATTQQQLAQWVEDPDSLEEKSLHKLFVEDPLLSFATLTWLNKERGNNTLQRETTTAEAAIMLLGTLGTARKMSQMETLATPLPDAADVILKRIVRTSKIGRILGNLRFDLDEREVAMASSWIEIPELFLACGLLPPDRTEFGTLTEFNRASRYALLKKACIPDPLLKLFDPDLADQPRNTTLRLAFALATQIPLDYDGGVNNKAVNILIHKAGNFLKVDDDDIRCRLKALKS